MNKEKNSYWGNSRPRRKRLGYIKSTDWLRLRRDMALINTSARRSVAVLLSHAEHGNEET